MQEGNLWISKHQTINHALSVILIKRDGDKHTKENINNFAEYLSRGRDEAIKILWASGNERYVLGKGRIEAITNNPDDRDEHLSRIGQMLDHRRIAAKSKSLGVVPEKCKQFGLPLPKELKQSSQRLLLGDSDFNIHLKNIEANIDIYFCKHCHNKFPKPDDKKCPFCQSKNIKIV